MRPITDRFRIAVALNFVAALAVAAVPAPPIKPGLWEVTTVREDANGKQQADLARAQEAMANLPPAVRQQMEAMMKSRGMDMSGANGAIKMCMTKESFDSGKWQAMATGCTTDYSTQSASHWKWHSTCPSLKSESDGEAVFTSPESYTTKVVSTTSIAGTPRTSTMNASAKWLGANCGDLKPMTPDAVKQP